ncbi:hypothetical protein CYMTET_42805 [Cymbomonas tetramitiformis]|uniref:RAMA domain-containing protein n=1 Tax=Cymbomonas tetramitiformis TaxID=36881 RepID=A0AAE0F158_9CHLO|nr:hypothetical protein CYMTET_42805 [Cymbomonas tetramitiformis]
MATPPLMPLLAAGLLRAGNAALSVQYREKVYWGALLSDGTIEYQGKTFRSPSSFAVAVKRAVNPTKSADDGWKTVCYQGVRLEEYRNRAQGIPAKTTIKANTNLSAKDEEATAALLCVPPYLITIEAGARSGTVFAGIQPGMLKSTALMKKRSAHHAAGRLAHRYVHILILYQGFPRSRGFPYFTKFDWQGCRACEVTRSVAATGPTSMLVALLSHWFHEYVHVASLQLVPRVC